MTALRGPPSETSPKAEQPAAERPVETPDRPAEPAEKTERPAKPAEKEAQPGDQQASKEKKPDEKPRKSFLRRHPLMAGGGLIALFVGGGGRDGFLGDNFAFQFHADAFFAG